ncbi:MAG: NAD-binding protein [Campylobacterota bacterium]|nr:NAD-binding protein [Campylobacterota bacterium]
MKNKIIIYSFTQVAKEIAKVLKEVEYLVVIVEDDPKRNQEAKDLGYNVESISLLDDDNIIKLGIKDENLVAFFCFGDDKNLNLFITLSVRNLNKDLKIVSVSSTKEGNKTLLLAGASKVLNPYEIGGLRIFRLLHKPLILNVLDDILFSSSDIKIAEVIIPRNSIFDGIYLEDLRLIDTTDVIILGIQDREISDKFIFFATGINHKIDADDTLVILGYSQDLEKFIDMVNNSI